MSVFFFATVIKSLRYRYGGTAKTLNDMTRTQKINKIAEAAINLNFSESIENIEMLSYTREDGKAYEDRFDCIDTTTTPCTVRFIGGTGYEDFSVPLDRLTEGSMDKLVACIE